MATNEKPNRDRAPGHQSMGFSCLFGTHSRAVGFGRQTNSQDDKTYTITKRISKHGRQAVIVVPKLLETELPPGTVVELTMKVVREAEI